MLLCSADTYLKCSFFRQARCILQIYIFRYERKIRLDSGSKDYGGHFYYGREYYCDVMDEKEKIIAFMNDAFIPEGREGTG